MRIDFCGGYIAAKAATHNDSRLAKQVRIPPPGKRWSMEIRSNHPDSGPGSTTPTIDRLLRRVLELGGSDLLLVPKAPPCALVEGSLRTLEEGFWDGAMIEAAVVPALS